MSAPERVATNAISCTCFHARFFSVGLYIVNAYRTGSYRRHFWRCARQFFLRNPGAQIRLKNLETGRAWQTTADESGAFSITLLPIGTYEVSAETQGFKRTVVNDVVLRVNDNRRFVFTMEVGQLAEQVTVEATTVAVNVATGTTSQLLDGGDMVKMPSRGRNVQPFALLMPGVVSTTPYDRRNNNSAVNGVRPTHNAWLIDGGYNIDTGGNWGSPLAPNIETVAEFRAIRGNYSAEFGTGGGSQFNVITKGGTND
ncbi:MAG: carboxypeptidase-like regulatory domain-containing protein, partial [Bryobacteraceae bacterium]